jgi:hypothetical protein
MLEQLEKKMEQLYGWVADRFDCDHVAMRSAGRDWLRGACTVLAICSSALILVFALGSQPEGSLLRNVLLGLPDWVLDAALLGSYAGLLMACYGWLLRHVSGLLRGQL